MGDCVSAKIFTDRSNFKTEEECVQVAVKYAAQFNWIWASTNLLSVAALAEYRKTDASARADRRKTIDAAGAKYRKAAARAVRRKAVDADWAEFDRASTAAWDEYRKASAPADVDYRKAIAAAFARAWFNDEEAVMEMYKQALGVRAMDIENIRGALARGYCHEGQTHKVMDLDLCEAQAQEILALLPKEVEAQPDNERDPYSEFQKALEGLINTHSLENRTDTPDFILAEYVVEGLRALEHQHHAKQAWNSPDMKGPTA